MEPSTEITKRYYYANKKNYQEEIDIDYRKILRHWIFPTKHYYQTHYLKAVGH